MVKLVERFMYKAVFEHKSKYCFDLIARRVTSFLNRSAAQFYILIRYVGYFFIYRTEQHVEGKTKCKYPCKTNKQSCSSPNANACIVHVFRTRLQWMGGILYPRTQQTLSKVLLKYELL